MIIFYETSKLALIAISLFIFNRTNSDHKNHILRSATTFSIVNSSVLLVYISATGSSSTFITSIYYGIMMFSILFNECFLSTYITVYFLEVTIEQNYSLLNVLKNLAEAAYIGFYICVYPSYISWNATEAA